LVRGKEASVKQETRDSILGKVTSRECPLCGHHEIGFVTQEGEFHSLRSGTIIRVLGPAPQGGPARDEPETPIPTQEEELIGYRVWIPEPLRGDRVLRLKYGVMVKDHLFKGEMSEGLYELATVEKLERLIEKVLDVPLAVVLDRFFAAPHLSSGDPRQVAEAMYRELNEIRQPVVLMQEWLKKKDDRSLADLIAPKAIKDLGQEPAEDAQVEKELEALSFEEFLGML
jgi:hypothetical protein